MPPIEVRVFYGGGLDSAKDANVDMAALEKPIEEALETHPQSREAYEKDYEEAKQNYTDKSEQIENNEYEYEYDPF